MSDIQDLIHKTSMDCIERGKIVERDRIIKLLEQDIDKFGKDSWLDVIELIKGETNAASKI
jgi:hypothetical protein